MKGRWTKYVSSPSRAHILALGLVLLVVCGVPCVLLYGFGFDPFASWGFGTSALWSVILSGVGVGAGLVLLAWLGGTQLYDSILDPREWFRRWF